MLKNKTVAVYLAVFLGFLGAHRFYLKGRRDRYAWLYVVFSSLGGYGFLRLRALGQDDQLSWLLVPLFGGVVVMMCLAAIFYGLTAQSLWNQRYNPEHPTQHRAGASTGLTVTGVGFALLLGATALMSVIAYGGQRFFEYVLATAPV